VTSLEFQEIHLITRKINKVHEAPGGGLSGLRPE